MLNIFALKLNFLSVSSVSPASWPLAIVCGETIFSGEPEDHGKEDKMAGTALEKRKELQPQSPDREALTPASPPVIEVKPYPVSGVPATRERSRAMELADRGLALLSGLLRLGLLWVENREPAQLAAPSGTQTGLSANTRRTMSTRSSGGGRGGRRRRRRDGRGGPRGCP